MGLWDKLAGREVAVKRPDASDMRPYKNETDAVKIILSEVTWNITVLETSAQFTLENLANGTFSRAAWDKLVTNGQTQLLAKNSAWYAGDLAYKAMHAYIEALRQHDTITKSGGQPDESLKAYTSQKQYEMYETFKKFRGTLNGPRFNGRDF